MRRVRASPGRAATRKEGVVSSACSESKSPSRSQARFGEHARRVLPGHDRAREAEWTWLPRIGARLTWAISPGPHWKGIPIMISHGRIPDVTCDVRSRRGFLRAGAAGALGLTFGDE